MKMLRSILTGVLVVTLATACSDSTAPTDVTADDLVGTWEATAVTFSVLGSPPIDVLALGGGVTLVIRDNSTYTVTFDDGETSEVENGTYTVSAGVITITPTEGEPEELTIVSLEGNTLTLSMTAVEEVGEVEVSGTMTMVLERQ
jgi:hypothetical protein